MNMYIFVVLENLIQIYFQSMKDLIQIYFLREKVLSQYECVYSEHFVKNYWFKFLTLNNITEA